MAFFKNALLALAPRGSIIVTLFEGAPYTLWNIRDLGRHSGLQVERSFKFQAAAYPGYKHSRTLGVIKRKDGKEGGGWKGEERESRSYVFVRKGDVIETASGLSDKRKRGDSSESEADISAAEEENLEGSEDEQEEAGEGEDWGGITDSHEDGDEDEDKKDEPKAD